ncbi:hypothetical protein LSAT2_011459 [Lamellibrachia satsuma]|nr:hypothetical protein LSAT2_011459 [Lamellibrachia satsuma]
MCQIQDTLSTPRLSTSSEKGITPGRVQIDRNPFDRLLPFSPFSLARAFWELSQWSVRSENHLHFAPIPKLPAPVTPLCVQALMCATNGGATSRSLDNRGSVVRASLSSRRVHEGVVGSSCCEVQIPRSSKKCGMSDQSGHKPSLGAEGPIVPNGDHIAVLVNMGVTREHAVRALMMTGNVSAEVAAQWIFANRDSATPFAKLRAPSLGLEDADSPKGHKMVLVVNTGLDMDSCNLAKQVAHASLGVYRAMMIEEERFGKMLLRWEECGERVVVLQDTGSHALFELSRQATLLGLPNYLVDDVNKTHGAPGSATVLGMLGTTDKVEKIIKSLKTL